jgi:glucose/arabinose dehydrogenase/mono/diheme cytochrome c family protein
MNRSLAFYLFSICSALLLFSCGHGKPTNTISTDSSSIARGKIIFDKSCSGCHGFLQDGIGPDLSGIIEKDSADWIRQFIHSPQAMVETGDVHAKQISESYHTVMPAFPAINEEEMDQLISFLNTNKGGKKEKDDPLAIKNPIPGKIEASDIQINLTFFNQLPPSSDKQPLTRISKIDWVTPVKSCFILDQRGKLYKLENQKPVVWLDISKWKPDFINEPGLATGFGSFAFHPDYAKNGIFYTTHSEKAHARKADFSMPDTVKQTLQWVLCEWKTSNPRDSTFSGSCRELMRIEMVAGIHGVQEIIFNPASKPGNEDYGKLYIGVGDGGSAENRYLFLTHHPDKIWGTILRIDPRGKNSSNGQYGIPKQNPFAKNKDSNIVREIYAYGFRNPNRITWTRKGLMLATNIGQSNIEAIDIVAKGQNYGWPIREGRFAVHPDSNINRIYPLPPDDSSFKITYPVAVFDHDEGKAIEGGFEYDGKDIPSLKGKYLFGDIPTGRLFYVNVEDLKQGKQAIVKEWFVSLNGKRLSLRTLCGQNRVDLRFAKDDKGEIYLFTKPDGKIYRLTKP